ARSPADRLIRRRAPARGAGPRADGVPDGTAFARGPCASGAGARATERARGYEPPTRAQEVVMAHFGWKLMSEIRSPRELIDQAVEAEARGLEFVSISDHFHPWLPEHGHSPYAWSVLGAIAERTERIGLVTGVTCPVGRYEPAIVAQAAATIATMSGDRLVLGVGSGERLNEHVTGRPFP